MIRNGAQYVPDFQIRLGGVPMPAAMRGSVSSVTCESGLDGVDRVECTLSDMGLRWLEYPGFRIGTEIVLDAGYRPDGLRRLFAGEIVGRNASFPSGGHPTVTLVAQDRRTRMQETSAVRWFAIPTKSYGNAPIPDPAVATLLIAERLLIPLPPDPVAMGIAVLLQGVEAFAALDPKNPKSLERIIRRQHGQSNYDFLNHLAKENGWEILVDHEVTDGFGVRFISPGAAITPEVTLRYGRSLIDFSTRVSRIGQVVGVTVNVWRPELKMTIAITVAWDPDRQSLDLTVRPVLGLPPEAEQGEEPSPITVVQEPVTLASAPRIIISKLIPRLNNRVTCSGTVVGEPRLRAGSVVAVDGVGTEFGGRYRITSATHSIDAGGYRTRFEARKEIWFTAIQALDTSANSKNPMAIVAAG